MFFCEFCKIFKNSFFFDRTPPNDCFLCLSVNFETFFRTVFFQSILGKLLFYVQVAEFQSPDTVKNYFTSAFQAFYTRSRSCEMPTRNFMKKALSRILCHVFCLHFLRMHLDYFSQRGFGSVRAQFLSGNVGGKWCYL